MVWTLNQIDQQLIDMTLAEDLQTPFCDATCQLLFANQTKIHKIKIISKHENDIVLAGLPVLTAIMQRFTEEAHFDCFFKDGDTIKPGNEICHIEAQAHELLMAERTLLNFLRHLCAIATLTKQFVDITQNYHTQILDTRKTTPGFRHLDKYAVHCGGGVNHRQGLFDAIMIKDTHIDLCGDMRTALAKLPLRSKNPLPVIVEIRDRDELLQCIDHGRDKVTRVLLDNMNTTELTECVQLCRDVFATEASGNINLSTIEAIAKTGVDFASVGMITHSAGNVDISIRAIK